MARAEVTIDIVFCPEPRRCEVRTLTLPSGATLADALHASDLPQRHALALEGLRVGVWGRLRPLETVLRDRDRVEIYRGLLVDPKEARRQRYKRHRERIAAGKAG